MRTFFEIILVLLVVALVGCNYFCLQKLESAKKGEGAQQTIAFTDEDMTSLRDLAQKLGKTLDEEASVTEVISEIRIALNNPEIVPSVALEPKEVDVLKSLMSLETDQPTVDKIIKMNQFFEKFGNRNVVVLPEEE